MLIIRNLRFILQEKNYDCGVSCLLMIARYYNCNVSKDYIQKISMTMKDGTTMYGLMMAAKTLGFTSYGKKGCINDISKSMLPLIAHIKVNEHKNLYHYIVITKISSLKVMIKDPSCGSKTLSKEEFEKIETGNYLFIKETNNIKRFVKRKIIKDTIKEIINANKAILILIVVSIIISIGLELLNLFSLKIILNNAILVKSIYNLFVLLSIFFYLLLLKTGFSYFIQIYQLKLSRKLSLNLKSNLIKHLLALPNLYYQTKEKGSIISLFNDIDVFADSLLSSIIIFINSSFILIFIYIIFVKLSFILALILIISSFILFLFIYSQKAISMVMLSSYYKVRDNFINKLQYVTNSNDKIKGLHLEHIIFKRLGNTTDLVESNKYAVTKYSELIKNILSLLESFIYLLILGVSGFILITTNHIELTTFLLLESFIFMGLKNVENLILIILKYQNLKKIRERLNEIFDYEKEVLIPFTNYNYVTKNMNIKIINLSFKYANNIILDNINLMINSKDKVFIYGASGSGKSTFVKLLARLLPLEYGHIKLGNIDLVHYNLADLRNIVTYVSNKDMLSNTSIKNNIYLSRKPKINQNTLLNISGVDKLFKDKKYNLYTVLEEGGENISMGEKSRISLAQALFKQSEIYIFDECLSNVDVKLERQILENILRYYHNKIIIYISHRLANKDLFDRIFYLESGKCYEKL